MSQRRAARRWLERAASACLLLGCDTIELHFDRLSPAQQATPDGIGDAEAETAIEASAPAECERFPEPCGGASNKCTLLFLGPIGGYRSACVPLDGDRVAGDECERRAPGYDNCALSAFCSPVGLGTPGLGPYACHTLCTSDDACRAVERCFKLPGGQFGICLESCEIFDTSCAAGARCVPGGDMAGRYFGYCSRIGEGREDEPCVDDIECAESLVCEQESQRCRALCGSDHVCPTGRRCLPLGIGDPASPRLCLP